MSPKVSVLMPAFNVQDYIEEAIDSILNQTFKELELIIIDDCSSDKTWEIILRKAKFDKRIIFKRNRKNSGIAYTLNKALVLAQGEYIVRMDSDDISMPERIAILLQEINDRKLDLLGSSTITIDSQGRKIGAYKTLTQHSDIVKTIKYASPILHIWICKKELYGKIGEYRNPPVEDYDFILRCIKGGATLGNSNKELYKVRIRNGNTVDLYGFKQLRAFEGTYKNHIANSNKELKKDLKFDFIREFLYAKSHKVMMSGRKNLSSGNKTIAFLSFFFAAMISPYQFRYLWRRCALYLYQRKVSNNEE